jgi:hypothetical protein
VSEYVATKVEGDLSGYRTGARQGGVGSLEGMPAVVDFMRQIAEGVSGTRNPRTKTVEEAYRETYPVLLRFCHVDSRRAGSDMEPMSSRLEG